MYKSVEEFSVNTLEIGGLGSALEALHLPFGKESKSIVEPISFSAKKVSGERAWPVIAYGCQAEVCPKDLELLSALVKNGNEHAKVIRGVVVWCEINAPRYWWVEMDTYRIGAERLSSESTMHIQGRGLSEDELIEMKESLPESTMQKRVWMFSYQTLRRIYFQRRYHRLPQWRSFCEWIKYLPFADELIICDGNNNTDKSVSDSNNN